MTQISVDNRQPRVSILGFQKWKGSAFAWNWEVKWKIWKSGNVGKAWLCGLGWHKDKALLVLNFFFPNLTVIMI